MSIKLKSASICTWESDPSSDDLESLEELKTERSHKLGRMMVDIRDPQKQLFSYGELKKLGSTVISLPKADSLLSNEGSFRPHSPFTPDTPVKTKYWSEYNYRDVFNISSMEHMARDIFSYDHESKGYGKFEDIIYPWQEMRYVVEYSILPCKVESISGVLIPIVLV